MRAAPIRVNAPTERHARLLGHAVEDRFRPDLVETRLECLGCVESTDDRLVAIAGEPALLLLVDRQVAPPHEHMFAYRSAVWTLTPSRNFRPVAAVEGHHPYEVRRARIDAGGTLQASRVKARRQIVALPRRVRPRADARYGGACAAGEEAGAGDPRRGARRLRSMARLVARPLPDPRRARLRRRRQADAERGQAGAFDVRRVDRQRARDRRRRRAQRRTRPA